jgi:phosphotransacetylase
MSEAQTLFDPIVAEARSAGPVRVAVVDAAQPVVLESLREAVTLGLATPLLIGDTAAVEAACDGIGWRPDPRSLVAAAGDPDAARRAVSLVREGKADIVMKGNIHTDVLMRALLDSETGLRQPGRRVSHVFLLGLRDRDRLLGVTDAAINITPDLAAKAQICQNAIDLFHLLGIAAPKVAALSAVETVGANIVSSLDAACLTLMARRGQITGGRVDGPLAFDNAISPRAAAEKGIDSDVAGAADILLVPDLVSGNMLAKALEYLAGATAAGLVLGLSAPVVLTSRADPAPARLAALAVAGLMHHRNPGRPVPPAAPEPSLGSAPQPEHACCPLEGAT